MKAVRIEKPYEVKLCGIPEPTPGPGEVLIEVRALGLCGSDLTTYRGLNPMVGYPRIPGHEIAGRIVETGADVPAELPEGLAVTVSPYTACGRCPACRQGRVNCCRFNETMGVQRDGAATERIVVPHAKVFPAEGFTDEQIACIEPFSVGWHAVQRGAVTAEDQVLVFGCGVIGLGAIAAAAERGATVLAVDIDDDKLERAKKLGARFGINSAAADLPAAVAAITSGEGPSVVIEAVGLPQTFRQAVDLVAFAGRVVYIGYAKKPVEYETRLFVSKELDIRGSRNAFNDEIAQVIEMFRAGRVDTDLIVTQRYSLTQAGEALEFWDQRPQDVTKIILNIP